MNTAVAVEFVALAAIWGVSFLFTRLAVVEFGPFGTAFLRVLLAALFLLPVLAISGHFGALRRHWRAILLIGLISSGIPFALFAFAVLHISTGLTSILNAATPLFGALVAWVWLKDRPSASRNVGLAIGFLGVVLLSWDKVGFKEGGSGWAVLACLGATLCYGLAGSCTKKFLAGVPPLATATGSQIGAALGLAIPAAFWFPPLTGTGAPGLRAWAAVTVAAVLCTGIAYVLYFRLIERLGPARAMTVTYLIPVFGVGYGVSLLGETFTPWMGLCGAIIVAGTALASGVLKLPAWPRLAKSS